jgi:hypothetical protein
MRKRQQAQTLMVAASTAPPSRIAMSSTEMKVFSTLTSFVAMYRAVAPDSWSWSGPESLARKEKKRPIVTAKVSRWQWYAPVICAQ